MIDVVEGCHIRRILGRATSQPHLFKRVVVAAPFVDYRGVELLHRLYVAARCGSPVVQVITTPAMRELIERYCVPRPGFSVRTDPDLHAKLYLVEGRNPADHEALVTSANLTSPGLGANRELGIRLTSSSPALTAIIERLADQLLN